MPELPETETIARDLDRELRGRTITSVVVRRHDVLREVDAAALIARTTRAVIQRCWRRAKLVVIDLNTGDRLVVQPRFTGAMLLSRGALPEREAAYSTLHFALDDGRDLHYRDIRRLGTVALMSAERFAEYTDGLGVEPLSAAFTVQELASILGRSRQALKKALMDQRLIAGMGNIYANEACWRAGIDPSRVSRDVTPPECESLHAGIVGVLTESIAARGTSFRDYVDASGGKGGFEPHLAAYGRGGAPCLRCGARLVETHVIDGRTTVFCARCQR